jgi:thiamine biosynthesis lipoprotein
MNLHSFSFGAMGSPCTLHLYAATALDASRAADAAEAEIARLEARYSRYRPDSELSRINAAAALGGSVTLDEETSALLDYAFVCFRKSGGLFDITSGLLRQAWNFSQPRLPSQSELDRLLPFINLGKLEWSAPLLRFPLAGMELDFGGIVKEYAADRAAEVCLALGIRHGIVELGGDVRLIGPHPDASPWRIGIRHPRLPDTVLAAVELASGSLATSGDYERSFLLDGIRYCHLLNPRTGWPVRGLAAVSVHAETCLVAGSVASIAMLKQLDGIAWLASAGAASLSVDEQGRTIGTLLSAAPSLPPF